MLRVSSCILSVLLLAVSVIDKKTAWYESLITIITIVIIVIIVIVTTTTSSISISITYIINMLLLCLRTRRSALCEQSSSCLQAALPTPPQSCSTHLPRPGRPTRESACPGHRAVRARARPPIVFRLPSRLPPPFSLAQARVAISGMPAARFTVASSVAAASLAVRGRRTVCAYLLEGLQPHRGGLSQATTECYTDIADESAVRRCVTAPWVPPIQALR